MGLESNVLAFVAKAYGLRDSRALPAAVATFVELEVTRCRTKGVLSAADIQRIARQAFDDMPAGAQRHFTEKHARSHNFSIGNSPAPSRPPAAFSPSPDAAAASMSVPTAAANNNDTHGNAPQHASRSPSAMMQQQPPVRSSSAAVVGAGPAAARRPAVPKCGIRKEGPIRRHNTAVAGAAAANTPTPGGGGQLLHHRHHSVASNSNKKHQQEVVDQFLAGVLRPKSVMSYTTQNSFRRLQRQKLDADWNEHVQAEARAEERERQVEKQREFEKKKALSQEVRQFYHTRARATEDKFLEREAERIESEQWHAQNTRLEQQERAEAKRRRKEEFEVVAAQAAEAARAKRREEQERKRYELELRHDVETGVAADAAASKKRFSEMRACFLDSLKEGTAIARRHRDDERRERRQEAARITAEAKTVAQVEKQREAEEKARRLVRVKKHEALQARSAALYEERVHKKQLDKEAHERERNEKEIRQVEEQFRQRRVSEKAHEKAMRAQLQGALKSTVEVHREQKAEQEQLFEKDRKQIAESVRKEAQAAERAKADAAAKRARLREMQEEEIARRTRMLLEPPLLKVTEKQKRSW